MRSSVVGFECANSFVKVFRPGALPVIYPNTLSRATKESYKLTVRGTETVYKINGEKFHAGRTFDYISSGSQDIQRYESEQFFREAIIALSHVVKDGEAITAVTAIPSSHYDSKEVVTKMIKKSLTGTYTIYVNDEELTFTIRDVLVTLQPLATFFYTVLDEDGELDKNMADRYEDTKTLVIDIGWGTTDLAEIYGSSLNTQSNITTSMKTAYERILQDLKGKYPKDPIATANIQLLELEKQLRKKGTFKYGNQEYDVTKIKSDVFEQIAKDILTESNNWRGFQSFTTIILTGGGVQALKEFLLDALTDQNTGKLQENIFPMYDAQLANVKGCFVFGQYIEG